MALDFPSQNRPVIINATVVRNSSCFVMNKTHCHFQEHVSERLLALALGCWLCMQWVISFTVFVLGGSCTTVLGLLKIDMGVESRNVSGVKVSRHSKEMKNSFQLFDRVWLLPMVTCKHTHAITP